MRPLVRRLAYFTFLLGFGLVLTEVVLRLSGRGYPSYYRIYEDVLLKPGPGTWTYENLEKGNFVRFNNWGLRDVDREVDYDGYRIVAFGDSLVEGLQVELDELFTLGLGERLSEAVGSPVEAVNAGVSGYGTAEQYMLWQLFFDGEIPFDHALLTVYSGNDLKDNVEGNLRISPTGELEMADIVPDASQRAQNWLSRHSALFHTVRRLWKQLRYPPTMNTASADFDAGGTLTFLGRWIDELSENGQIATVFFIAAIGDAAADELSKKLEETALAHGAGFVALREDDPDTTRYLIKGEHGHMTAAGHALAARTLAEALEPVVAEATGGSISPQAAKPQSEEPQSEDPQTGKPQAGATSPDEASDEATSDDEGSTTAAIPGGPAAGQPTEAPPLTSRDPAT